MATLPTAPLGEVGTLLEGALPPLLLLPLLLLAPLLLSSLHWGPPNCIANTDLTG
jgi:hypothetical protein